MQKTIYIKDEDLWREIRAMAGEQSISGYLVSLHREHVERDAQARVREDTINEQITIVEGLSDFNADLL